MRNIIQLHCTTCRRRNYTTTKNTRKQSGRLEVRKFCRSCRAHTVHREGK